MEIKDLPQELAHLAQIKLKPNSQRQKELKQAKSLYLHSLERTWLKKHGKRSLIDFETKDRATLQGYFNSLDQNYSGNIGVIEMEDPLVALGLVNNRQEIEEMIKPFDKDNSKSIEFSEFLGIIKGGAGSNQIMTNFFRKMTQGTLVKDSKYLDFNMVVSQYRRRKLVDACISKDPVKKVEGEKVMKAYARQRAQQNMQEKSKNQNSTLSNFDSSKEQSDSKRVFGSKMSVF